MRNYIVFAGKSLKDFGVYISGPGIFDAPERDTKSVAIPGRNGELTLDNGRYKNQKGKYPAFIVKKLAKNAEGLRNYVLGLSGFQRFEDTYNPDEYRLAKYSGGFKFNPLDELKEAKFDLNFEFYPQRFLKIGEEYISLANGSSILNPTPMTAKPLIKMTTTSEGGFVLALSTCSPLLSAVVLQQQTHRINNIGRQYFFIFISCLVELYVIVDQSLIHTYLEIGRTL